MKNDEMDYDDEPEIKEDSKEKRSLSIVLLICILPVMWLIDNLGLHSRYTNAIRYGKEKNWQVPKEWQILSNGDNFIIKNKKSGNFLYNGKYGIEEYSPSIAYDQFLSVDNAKSYLKYYIESSREKANSGKEYK